MNKQQVRLSKFLSLVLRHEPERIGLTLGEGGWVEVATLLAAAQAANVALDEPLLQRIVAENDKQRFAFNSDGTLIRANQGHSVSVDLGLSPIDPPPILYHGTATRFVASIRATGLQPQKRTHVHLSADHATALKVGVRHGQPFVFRVNAAAMATDGLLFYRADNGVWLTAHVPPIYLENSVT